MHNVMALTSRRANRPAVLNKLCYFEEAERQGDCPKMHDVARSIVEDRKANPKPDAKDLPNVMLHSIDRETG